VSGSAVLGASLVLVASVACALSDARSGTIPNRITYPTFALLLLLGAWQHSFGATVLGATAAGGILLALHLATGSRGLGLGDVKLGACIGAGLGVWDGLVAIGAAFIAGACAALTLLAFRRARRGDSLPFGPYLALGTIFSVFGALKW
jgi:prepilin signal peptidase PulO-like enzyme (type II secretory pathway)